LGTFARYSMLDGRTSTPYLIRFCWRGERERQRERDRERAKERKRARALKRERRSVRARESEGDRERERKCVSVVSTMSMFARYRMTVG